MTKKTATPGADKPPTKLSRLSEAAEIYGLRSFDNYAQIRSLAEQLRDGLCEYLDSGQECVFLVPPQGAHGAMNYGSGAFSVSGKGFLPLEPISFGLAIKISGQSDYMRIVMHARKEGNHIYVQVEENTGFTFDLPLEPKDLQSALDGIYAYVLNWFESRVDRYDNGNYGSSDIGFDIQRIDSE